MAEQWGVKILLEGAPGTGKTFSIGSLVDAGVEVFLLSLETGREAVIKYYRDKGKSIPPNFHYAQIKGTTASFKDLKSIASLANSVLDEKELIHQTGNTRHKYKTLLNVYDILNDFVDERTGEHFGPVDSWDSSRALVLDSGTALANAAMEDVAGGQAVFDQRDYGKAQKLFFDIVKKLTDGCPCHFIFICHTEDKIEIKRVGGREELIQTGIQTIVVGNKIRNPILSKFKDVILAVRQGNKWKWDTVNPLADLRTCYLPNSSSLEPDFAQILTSWREFNEDLDSTSTRSTTQSEKETK